MFMHNHFSSYTFVCINFKNQYSVHNPVYDACKSIICVLANIFVKIQFNTVVVAVYNNNIYLKLNIQCI